jgi:outer membrane protein assembly factor BamB/tetratricopeptide (TPR) repeat protein
LRDESQGRRFERPIAQAMTAEISGFADDTILANAFTRIIEKRQPYSLVASDGVSERIFYFAIGGIRVIRSGPRKSASVGEILVDSGKLSPEDLGRVTASCKQDGRVFGEACVALGLLPQAEIEEALRAKVQDEILDLFLWNGAEIHLQEGQPPKAFYEGRFEAARISADVGEFLQTCLARVEDWRGVLGRLPTGTEVYEASEAARGEAGEGQKSRLLALLDGTRTASDAMARSGMRRVAAYEIILEGLRSGSIKRVAGGAAQKVSRDELFREVEALEDALKVNADATIVRGRLARALEAAGENSRAAAQWRFLGDKWRRENDLDRALDCYRNGVRAVPTDFATRELILEIHRHKRDYAQLVVDGRPLAELFLKHNLLNRAKNLLLQLVGLEAEDTALRRQLVMVLLGLGERDAALKQLRELAKILEKRKAPVAELRDVYVRILALDKKDKHAQERLDTITGAKFQRRVMRMTLGSTVAAMLLIGGWFFYEGSSRRAVNDAMGKARAQFDANDLAGAKLTLETALHTHAHARAAAAASTMLQQIEEYEKRENERLARIAAVRKGPRSDDDTAAKTLAQRARNLADAGKSDDAYRAYLELFELYGASHVAEQVSLPLKLTVLPTDAHVQLAGEELGQGALMLSYSPHAKCTLVVTRDGYVPYKRLLDGPQPPTMEVALEKATRWAWQTSASLDAPPLVSGGMVYVAGRDRYVTAMSAKDGAVQWRAPLGLYGDATVRPLMTSEGVFVAAASGEAVCLDPATGDVLWKSDVGVAVERQPTSATNDAVVVPANDGSLHALAVADGAKRWSVPAGASSGTPTSVENGRLAYLDLKGGLVYASAATGETLPGYAQPAVLRGTPVADDGRMWVMAEDASVRVIATETRRAVKRFAVPAASEFPPTVAGDVAYVVGTDGGVHGFRAGGDALFHVKLDEPASAAPALSKGLLYVPGTKGHVSVLDAANGTLLWRFDAKSRVTSTPVVAEGTVYVTTVAGKLFAVEE